MLKAVSPIDGRYQNKTYTLGEYFSEFALIKYRVFVEIEYFKSLTNLGLSQLNGINPAVLKSLDTIMDAFDETEAQKIKDIEKVTNHDVKAVEYYLKEKFDLLDLQDYKEFIHFGLTSQDINNTAFPLMIKDALTAILIPTFEAVLEELTHKANEYNGIPMLARTHGQPASPTTLGKEFEVFIERITTQLHALKGISHNAKFGGATGNLNAHKTTFPEIDWIKFANDFVSSLGLTRSQKTTQIEHYDQLAALCHNTMRINTILIDFTRDIWTYISMDYFKQKIVKNEVGSSAMPHKVNPIDFENAEGNLGIANTIFDHLANKLPISRLQRDLTDSTVLRNIGVPFAHTLISLQSISKGLGKLLINTEKLAADLDENWAVVAEAIQNVLRRENFDKPYEALKDLTRGKAKITEGDIKSFINGLPVSESTKMELLQITPFNYVGYF
ncbi:MAG TPA: adenylosuccinate lyase [Saprospiraceae bacterium]|nr:adenylosuccinate lyase [Saprospiraceae bacterium]HPN68644.1 adenylosuccinate lyase [Saprospiraceae bacterium]